MGETNPGSVVLSTITEFCAEFRSAIDGNTNDLSLNELSGGARISFVFHELFNNGVKGIDPFDQVKDGDIRTILYNSSGSTPSLFVGTTAFEVIVKQQIRRLEDPALRCCALVYDELIRILGSLLSKTVRHNRPLLIAHPSPPSSDTLSSRRGSISPSSTFSNPPWPQPTSSSRTWSPCRRVMSTPPTQTLSAVTRPWPS